MSVHTLYNSPQKPVINTLGLLETGPHSGVGEAAAETGSYRRESNQRSRGQQQRAAATPL